MGTSGNQRAFLEIYIFNRDSNTWGYIIGCTDQVTLVREFVLQHGNGFACCSKIRSIVLLKQIEYGFGYITLRSPHTPYSIYLRGTLTQTTCTWASGTGPPCNTLPMKSCHKGSQNGFPKIRGNPIRLRVQPFWGSSA